MKPSPIPHATRELGAWGAPGIRSPLDPVRGVRIAHLIETDGPGGAERVVALLATLLQEAGAENLVCVPTGGEGWLEEQLVGTGVEVEHFPTTTHRISRVLSRWLQGTLARHGTQVAHSHEFTMAVYGAWACRRAKIPHVITMHGSGYYGELARRRVALRLASALSECTVAVSHPLRRQIVDDLGIPLSRVLMVPNGVPDTAGETSTLREDLGLHPRDRLIVSVGNLYPVKGHGTLVEALGLLKDEFGDLHLAIAGRGDLHDTLLALADRLGVEARVHLLGLRSDVAALLPSADVFALPSLSEGLPMALLEAMFASLPVVATRVGQVPEVLDGGRCGLLVPPGNAKALAGALRVFLTDPAGARRMGRRARDRALQGFGVERMAARYTAVYGRLLRSSRRASVPDAARARPGSSVSGH